MHFTLSKDTIPNFSPASAFYLKSKISGWYADTPVVLSLAPSSWEIHQPTWAEPTSEFWMCPRDEYVKRHQQTGATFRVCVVIYKLCTIVFCVGNETETKPTWTEPKSEFLRTQTLQALWSDLTHRAGSAISTSLQHNWWNQWGKNWWVNLVSGQSCNLV